MKCYADERDYCRSALACYSVKRCIFFPPIITSDKLPKDVILYVDKYGTVLARLKDIKMDKEEKHGSKEFYSLLQEMEVIHSKKSHDYASNENPYGNYEFAGMMSQLFKDSRDAGFIGRIGEKLYRLANIENNNKIVLNESVEDTERDLATIIALWIASRRDRRDNDKQPKPSKS